MIFEPAPELNEGEYFDEEEQVLWTIDVNPKATAEHAVQFKGTPLDVNDKVIRWRRADWPHTKAMEKAMEAKLAEIADLTKAA